LFVRIIDGLQQQAMRRHADEMARYEEEVQRHELQQREWVSSHGVGSPPRKPTEPVCERYYTGDPTLEAVAMLLARRWRGMLLLRDELSGWVDSFNQYRGGKGGDVA